MAISRELIESRSIIREKGGKKRGVRVYQIEGTSPDAAPEVALTSGPPIPKPGSDRFPTDPSLLCDNLSCDWERGSVDTVRVVATFTNDGSGSSLPNIDPLDPLFASWSIERRVVTEEIPYAVYDTTAYSYSNVNGVEKNISAWTVQSTPVMTTLEVIIRRVNCEGVSYAEIERVGNLTNTLVKLPDVNGRWYRFICGTFNENAPGKWSVEYHFERDPGVPDLPQFDPNIAFADVRGPAGLHVDPLGGMSGPGYTGTYTRPPFHKIAAVPGIRVPGSDPVAFRPPTWVPIQVYAVSPGTAFASLPGWR